MVYYLHNRQARNPDAGPESQGGQDLKRYVVVGAGAAGLTLAYLLTKAGLPVTVVEKESEVGGLARSFHYDEWHFDIGPHRFYSANPVVGNFLTEVMGDDFLEISRTSAVHFMGHYHSWPLRLETLPKLPLGIAFRAGLDLLGKAARTSEDSVSFEDYVLRRYGRTLYQTFFRDYTEKFLGIPASDTHQNWAKVGVERATIDEKVNTASLAEIFKLMLIPKPRELNFLYPRRDGVHAFWRRCAEKVVAAGGEILTGKVPQRLETGPEGLQRLVLDDRTLDCEVLAWSGPVPELARMLHRPAPNLSYRSHVVYNILLDSPPVHDYQWCYFGAKDLVFSRLSNPASFSPHTVPSGRGGLCLEIPCQEGDLLWEDPARVRRQVVEDLLRVQALRDEAQIQAMKIERVRDAYPVYHVGYPERLDQAFEDLQDFPNLHLLGRTGRFWYNNMDHSIENAFALAGELLDGMAQANERTRQVRDELLKTRPPATPTPEPAVARA